MSIETMKVSKLIEMLSAYPPETDFVIMSEGYPESIADIYMSAVDGVLIIDIEGNTAYRDAYISGTRSLDYPYDLTRKPQTGFFVDKD